MWRGKIRLIISLVFHTSRARHLFPSRRPPGELKLMLNLFNLGFDFQPNQLKLKFDLRSQHTHTHLQTYGAGIWEKSSEREKHISKIAAHFLMSALRAHCFDPFLHIRAISPKRNNRHLTKKKCITSIPHLAICARSEINRISPLCVPFHFRCFNLTTVDPAGSRRVAGLDRGQL